MNLAIGYATIALGMTRSLAQFPQEYITIFLFMVRRIEGILFPEWIDNYQILCKEPESPFYGIRPRSSFRPFIPYVRLHKVIL